VVEVILDEFGDEVDDPLYLLPSGERLVLAKPEEMDDGLREDDLADLEINLLVLEYLNLLNPAVDAHVLEDVDGNVDYRGFVGLL